MLTDFDRPATPRPRPPAKARRALSTTTAPALFLTTSSPTTLTDPQADGFLASPARITPHFSLHSGPQSAIDPLQPTDWANEQSKEELRQLLHKAESTIKERETELEWTSTVARSLYEGNVALKEKHEALVSQLPQASGSSSSLLAPFPKLDTIPSLSSDIDPTSSAAVELLSPTRFGGTVKRISVSPSDIALLADQNAELMSKIESLEAESTNADLAGKRKLRKLEHEIAGLREELERTQQRSKELETQVKSKPAGLSQEAWLKRKEREERVRAIRGRTESEGAWGKPPQLRDFAPAGGILASPSRRSTTPFRPSALSVVTQPPSMQSISRSTSQEGTEDTAPAKAHMRFPSLPSPPGSDSSDEHDEIPKTAHPLSNPDEAKDASPPREREEVVAQLLAKIKELEDANQQISSQQRDTDARLNDVLRDADRFRRLYDYIGDKDKVDLHLVDEAAPPSGLPSPPAGQSRMRAMRFQSLRRRLDKNSPDATNDDDFFASGARAEIQNSVPEIHRPAPRRPLSRLFEQASEDGERAHSPTPSSSPPNPRVVVEASSPPRLVSPRPVDAWSPPSLTLDTAATLVVHSLGSELGSEYGGDDTWSARDGGDHSRNSSLDKIVHLQGELTIGDSEIPPSPSPSAREMLEDSDMLFSAESPLSPSVDIEGVTPSKDRTLRSRRLSATMRERSGRWNNARFGELSVDSRRASRTRSNASSSDATAAPTPTKSRFQLMNAFVGRLTGSAGEESEVETDARSVITGTGTSVTGDGDDESEAGTEGESRSLVAVKQKPLAAIPERRIKSVGHMVMEVYLWIQFALIIGLFVWTMLRRGPRVLAQNEKKRGGHGRSGSQRFIS